MGAKLGCTMSAAVIEAKRLANELIRFESRGAGDTENAMRRLANRYGISWRVFWNLRYRAPQDVFVSVFEKLQEAHRAECGRQIERLRHEIQIAKLSGVHVEDLQDQVSALAAELEACLAHRDERDA
jgi:2-phospho-L-lactate transferase/gluconeogenesis factor (CofD/UPF0052 family)